MEQEDGGIGASYIFGPNSEDKGAVCFRIRGLILAFFFFFLNFFFFPSRPSGGFVITVHDFFCSLTSHAIVPLLCTLPIIPCR